MVIVSVIAEIIANRFILNGKYKTLFPKKSALQCLVLVFQLPQLAFLLLR